MSHGRCVCQYRVRHRRGASWAFVADQSNRNFAIPDLTKLVEALLEQLPEESGSSVIAVKTERAMTPPNGQKPQGSAPNYDPSVAYILEFCTVLALRDVHTVEALGGPVTEALQSILRDATSHHPAVVSRTTLYLLRLLKASYVSLGLFCPPV
jgi:golgi-specific brefeldin A-resistance guanine nucleotide exchange factor 1